MGQRIKGSGILAILLTSIFLMYQETPAQPKRTTAARNQPATAAAASPEISYTVSMSKPWTHLLEVEMRVKWDRAPDNPDLKMPVWTPGSYLIREYARHVQDFSATTGGRSLTTEKINKNTWRIYNKGAKEIVVSYRVYSNELTVRTNELNDEHAFWNNAALLMFPAGYLNAASTVTVKPFGKWKVATGLPRNGATPNSFRAANFDVLYDSPFEVSDFREITFDVQGKPHRFVITGEGNYDLKQIAADTTKIAEESTKIFGELPVDDYLFIVNLRGSGGLEHLNSTALQWGRFNFKPRARYNGFLALIAHEYFHLWNVKRIRPDALGPFDYENENYTKLLWVAEGATAYYEGVLLRRAGLTSDRELLDSKATMIEQLQSRPGRFETSLEEASLDAWIKYYRQDENAVNNQISYYDKGEIVNMLLDIRIRTDSAGAKSLDDVMRYLYQEFYKKNRNYTPEDFQKAAELAAGKSLDDFFSKYVRGEAEIDFNGIFNGIGLELDVDESGARRAYIGADLTEDSTGLKIRAIPADTPAYEQGLNTGDQIVAIDGYRATNAFLQSYLGEKKPNDNVKLTIFRFDKMRDITFKLGANPRRDISIKPVDNPTELQQRLYRDYMKAELRPARGE
ncbi:MAG TPA: PDZ domain-containing protein [Pyrinomonadaceae bacterium]|nr:PDZ domain-containing protein [Pyrinomonadaceae bacterium]